MGGGDGAEVGGGDGNEMVITVITQMDWHSHDCHEHPYADSHPVMPAMGVALMDLHLCAK